MSGEDDASDLHVLVPGRDCEKLYICKCMQCIRKHSDKFLVLFLGMNGNVYNIMIAEFNTQ